MSKDWKEYKAIKNGLFFIVKDFESIKKTSKVVIGKKCLFKRHCGKRMIKVHVTEQYIEKEKGFATIKTSYPYLFGFCPNCGKSIMGCWEIECHIYAPKMLWYSEIVRQIWKEMTQKGNSQKVGK